MADITFRIDTKTAKAQRDFAKFAQSQEKIEYNARRASRALDQQGRSAERAGRAGNRGGSRGPNYEAFIPGGGASSQFNQLAGALGVGGIGAGLVTLKNAIDENTKALLDEAGKRQTIAQNIAPSAFFKGSEIRNFEKFRNDAARDTGIDLEEITKINDSLSGLVSSNENLKDVIRTIGFASKMDVGSIDDLIKLEQSSISSGGQAGQATANMLLGTKLSKGNAQFKQLMDEILEFDSKSLGFATALTIMDKVDPNKVEESFNKLIDFQSKDSFGELKRYAGIDKDQEGAGVLTSMFEYLDRISAKTGDTDKQVMEKIIKRGDIDRETADSLLMMKENSDELNSTLKEFNSVSRDSGSSLLYLMEQFEKLKGSNENFADSFLKDQYKIDKQIERATSDEAYSNIKFDEQVNLTEKAKRLGLSNLLNDEGMVDGKVFDKFTISMFDPESKINKAVNIGENISDIILPWKKGLKSIPFIGDMFKSTAMDIPIANLVANYGKTDKLIPGLYGYTEYSTDEEGREIATQKEGKTLGLLGGLGLEAALLFAGGGGGKLGGKVMGGVGKASSKLGKLLGLSEKNAAKVVDGLTQFGEEGIGGISGKRIGENVGARSGLKRAEKYSEKIREKIIKEVDDISEKIEFMRKKAEYVNKFYFGGTVKNAAHYDKNLLNQIEDLEKSGLNKILRRKEKFSKIGYEKGSKTGETFGKNIGRGTGFYLGDTASQAIFETTQREIKQTTQEQTKTLKEQQAEQRLQSQYQKELNKLFEESIKVQKDILEEQKQQNKNISKPTYNRNLNK